MLFKEIQEKKGRITIINLKPKIRRKPTTFEITFNQNNNVVSYEVVPH